MRRLRLIWPRTRRTLWLVFVNVAIFLSLVVLTNIVSGLLLELSGSPTVRSGVHTVLGIGRSPLTDNAKLPPYAGHEEQAKALWQELERSQDVVYAPFVEWKRRPFAGKWVNVSASGERIFRRPTELQASAPVIRFFGGSTMWGTGVVDSETIPAIYSRRHPGRRVHNHGDAALNSRQNLERLVNLITQGQRTDVAVFYEGFNDAITLCRAGVELNGHGEQVAMRRILSGADSLGQLFYGKTVQLLRKVVGAGHTELRCDRDPARARRVAETVLNIWKVARTLVNANCGRIVVALQPVAYVGRPSIDYLELADNRVFEEHGKELRAVYPMWQAAARRPENRSWLYDLTGAYDVNRPLYIDLVHVAGGGTAIMTRRMEPLIERALEGSRAAARHCRTRP